MNKRLETVKRILAVQTKLHQVAEWKLGQIERHEAALATARQDLARFVEQEMGLGPMLSGVVGKRRVDLDHQAARATRAKDIQAKRTMEEARREKLARRMLDQVARVEARGREAGDLGEIIERSLGRDDASLP